MKQTELMVLGLAGLAVYMIVSAKGGTGSGLLRLGDATTAEIFDTAGKPFSNGWRYYTDGTSIDPQGNYYQGGQLVWKAQ
jgi:hypothetical protein